MADVDYLRYAQLMGARNPTADGLASLGATIDQGQVMKRQAMIDKRQNSLADLQMQKEQMQIDEMTRKRDQKLALENKLSSLQPTTTTTITPSMPPRGNTAAGMESLGNTMLPQGLSRVTPPQAPQYGLEKDMRDAGLMEAPKMDASGFKPEVQQASPVVQAYNEGRVKTTTTRPSPLDAIAEYAMKTGDFDMVKNSFALDDVMRKRAAEVAAYGDQATADKISAEADRIEKTSGMLAKLKNADKTGELAKAYVSAHPDIFQGIKPENLTFDDDGIKIKTIDGTKVLIGPDGKPQVIKADAEVLLDKKLAATAAENEKNRASADARTEKQIAASDRKLAATLNGMANKTDPIVAREAIKDLPKLRKEANMAVASKERIGQMIGLMDKGSAGGLKGNVLQSVSGVFDVPATSEAELFKKLASAGAGQLRSTVIGPGQVSNYEQKLLQSVSGGGSGARTAVRELLLFYKQEADRTIGNYNDAAESAATIAPGVSKAFKPIGSSATKKDPLGIR